MKFSLGISNFLKEVSRLSHSVVFLHFFALIAEEGCLISPLYSQIVLNRKEVKGKGEKERYTHLKNSTVSEIKGDALWAANRVDSRCVGWPDWPLVITAPGARVGNS